MPPALRRASRRTALVCGITAGHCERGAHGECRRRHSGRQNSGSAFRLRTGCLGPQRRPACVIGRAGPGWWEPARKLDDGNLWRWPSRLACAGGEDGAHHCRKQLREVASRDVSGRGSRPWALGREAAGQAAAGSKAGKGARWKLGAGCADAMLMRKRGLQRQPLLTRGDDSRGTAPLHARLGVAQKDRRGGRSLNGRALRNDAAPSQKTSVCAPTPAQCHSAPLLAGGCRRRAHGRPDVGRGRRTSLCSAGERPLRLTAALRSRACWRQRSSAVVCTLHAARRCMQARTVTRGASDGRL